MLSFENKKALRFIITLGVGKFGSSDNNQIILQGFRATADINRGGGMMAGTLKAKIYGVSRTDMNSITTLQWKPQTVIPNTIEVFAIDGPVESLVFAGNIVNAWGDYQGAPDVFLHIQSQAAYFNQLKPVNPRSYKGRVDVASIMGQIARDMGYTFENNGVNVQLNDIYLPNTAMEQAKDLARMAGCDIYLEDKILAITLPNVPRHTIIPVISAATGLVGYPTFDGMGVNFQTLFNPAVTFGGAVKLETDVQQAAGEWLVSSVAHRLECERVGGAWFSNIRGTINGLAVTSR